MTSVSNDPIPYQIVITAFPPEDKSKAPSHCADIDPKAKPPKPYKPKNLSKDIFLAFKLGSGILFNAVAPTSYFMGVTVGMAGPCLFWKYRNVLPGKTIQYDTNMKDFGAMGIQNQFYYALFAIGFPLFVASSLSSSAPTLSCAIVGYNGYELASDLTQRFIRWINPPPKS